MAECEEVVCLPARVFRDQPVSINELLTKKEYGQLIEHMANGNPVSHFLVIWRDDHGNARYAKAKPHKRRDKAASWTYDAITGRSKRPTAIGLYPKNPTNTSTWGALDFDAHSGNDQLAKERSIKAFSLLLTYPDRYLLLSASGRGYHVFIFAREPRPVAEWALVLKDTCEVLGVPIQDGTCEAFPNERTETQEHGRAIRVPGAVHPITSEPEKILADTIRPLIEHLAAEAEKPSVNDTSRSLSNVPRKLLLDKEADNYSYTEQGFSSGSTGRLIDQIIKKHPIEKKSTRNGVLLKLVGELFHKFGRTLSEQIVGRHYELYQQNITTPRKDHMREFVAAWQSILDKNIKGFSGSEHCIFEQLNSEPQREAFLLLRSWSRFANGEDFQVVQFSLSDRLRITQRGVGYVLDRLVQLKAIQKVAEAQTHRRGALYRWMIP